MVTGMEAGTAAGRAAPGAACGVSVTVQAISPSASNVTLSMPMRRPPGGLDSTIV